MSRECNLCKFKDSIFLFSKNNYPVLKCKRCGLIYTDTQLSSASLSKFYDKQYCLGGNRIGYSNYILNESVFRKNCLKWLQEIMRFKQNGNLLEVGCSTGFFLDISRSKGWNVSGIEISEFSSQYAKKHFGLEVINDDFLNVPLAEESFDVIAMWDTIEHLPDPIGAIKKAYKILKPKGIFSILTGDIDSYTSRFLGANWRLMTPPLHLYFFSHNTLARALSENGFRILSISKPGKFVSLDLLLYQLFNLYFLFSQRVVNKALNKFRLNKINFYINLRDEILVTAEKL